MNLQEDMKKYAHLIVCAGCNLKPGQELFISASLQAAPLVRLVAKEAYRAGAKEVTVEWSDDQLTRLRYENSPMECFENFPKWRAELQNGMAERGAAILSILSSDPQALSGVDSKKLLAYSKAAHLGAKAFYDGMDFGRNVWCIVGSASPAWAKR
ncbi:MAG: aminopeptidase, partial [Oscillospiraceae bacterium]|nr:aminopeptidase [Oscillospiraceae bacterium]